MCQHNLPCSIVYAHCLLPGRAFASLYVLLFLEKEAEIGGREDSDLSIRVSSSEVYTLVFYLAIVTKVLRHCPSSLARQYNVKSVLDKSSVPKQIYSY